MSVPVSLDFEEFKKAVRNLNEDQQEELLFELHPPLREAVQKMEAEALEEEKQGKTTPVQDLE